MIHTWIVVVAAVCYLGLLFAIAWMGDRRAERRRSLIANPYVYALSIESTEGFIPLFDTASRDNRFLGVFVRLTPLYE